MLGHLLYCIVNMAFRHYDWLPTGFKPHDSAALGPWYCMQLTVSARRAENEL